MNHNELVRTCPFEKERRLFSTGFGRLDDLRTLRNNVEDRLIRLENQPDINNQEILKERAVLNGVQREIVKMKRNLFDAGLDMSWD